MHYTNELLEQKQKTNLLLAMHEELNNLLMNFSAFIALKKRLPFVFSANRHKLETQSLNLYHHRNRQIFAIYHRWNTTITTKHATHSCKETQTIKEQKTKNIDRGKNKKLCLTRTHCPFYKMSLSEIGQIACSDIMQQIE